MIGMNGENEIENENECSKGEILQHNTHSACLLSRNAVRRCFRQLVQLQLLQLEIVYFFYTLID